MKEVHLVVDHRIMRDDLLIDVGADERRSVLAAASRILPDTTGAESDADLVADALFYLHDDWERGYRKAGLSPMWLERVRQVRVCNRADFVTIEGFADIAKGKMWSDGPDGLVRTRRTGRVLHWAAVHTLAVGFSCPRSQSTTGPVATTSMRPLRPASGDTLELQELAAHLAPRLRALPGGGARLARAPLLAPIAAMVASIYLVMSETSRSARKRMLAREDVLDACLDALDLGAHRPTAERIVRRDHPEHLHVDAWTEAPRAPVDEHVAPSEIREGFGVFAYKDGSFSFVSTAERREYLPRVLFSLAGKEAL